MARKTISLSLDNKTIKFLDKLKKEYNTTRSNALEIFINNSSDGASYVDEIKNINIEIEKINSYINTLKNSDTTKDTSVSYNTSIIKDEPVTFKTEDAPTIQEKEDKKSAPNYALANAFREQKL